ncbi:protein kinase C-binding protein 1-like [Contarinia nasturtii]|uniref:protein kinase C-binding protein 1-like n=1 Tax=Contarinia nasturtii TaxID=265458 RepID=UPI0012D39C74|nr:protein kinase C-binding protein 1-like [Contarinia nasturtii]
MEDTKNGEMILLRHSFNRALKLKHLQVLYEPTGWSIGLKGIDEKFDEYANADEFLADIDELVKSFNTIWSHQRDIKCAITQLSELCHRDVKSIRTCSECFTNWAADPDDYFTKVCSKPHLLVYAKFGDYPYWPSKLMTINDRTANVVFFGDHTQADVPVEKCILYSKKHALPIEKDELYYALKETGIHIKKIKEKYGSFNPVTPRQTLNPTFYNDYILKMFNLPMGMNE